MSSYLIIGAREQGRILRLVQVVEANTMGGALEEAACIRRRAIIPCEDYYVIHAGKLEREYPYED